MRRRLSPSARRASGTGNQSNPSRSGRGDSVRWSRGVDVLTIGSNVLILAAAVFLGYQANRIAGAQNELVAQQVLQAEREGQPVFEIRQEFGADVDSPTTIQVVNHGAPALNLSAGAISFMEIGVGPCRADSTMAYPPIARYDDMNFYSGKASPVGVVASLEEDDAELWDTARAWNDEQDDEGERQLFLRPYDFVVLEYMDRYGSQRSDVYALPIMGGVPRLLEKAAAAKVTDEYEARLAAGAEVGAFPEGVDEVFEAWEAALPLGMPAVLE